MKRVGIGVIGCGNISSAYLTAAKKFPILEIVALSDANPAAAEARAAEFGLPVRPVDAVLANQAVEIILNLTVPKAHVEVGLKAIAAGKHVHSEKPLGVNVAEARTLIDAAAAKDVRVGCAPDTFLGGAHQTARDCIDEGLIGRPIGGAASFMCSGHESCTRIRASITSGAAAPCSTWGPTTSRTSSISSVRWRASAASDAHKVRARRYEPAARRNAHPR